MPKPVQTPRWEPADPLDIVEPLEAKKNAGWQPNEAPPAENFNWLFNRIYQWIAYLNTLEAEALVWTAIQTFRLGAVADPVADTTPALDVTTNPVGSRRLLFRFTTSAGKIRVYATTTGGGPALEFTHNIAWNQATSQWIPDTTNQAVVYRWGPEGRYTLRKPDAAAGVAFSTFTTVSEINTGVAIPWAANWSGTATYWLDAEGFVICQGRADKALAGGATMGTLPSGFRPAATRWFVLPFNTGASGASQPNSGASVYNVMIETNGNITGFAGFTGSTATFWLDPIRFKAA